MHFDNILKYRSEEVQGVQKGRVSENWLEKLVEKKISIF